jgi:hypothetical protein
MALFGRKKNKKAESEKASEVTQATENEIEEDAAENTEEKVEISAEDRFKQACGNISKSVRMVFPEQLVIGFYYGELQSGGYIDDFCCYATDGRLIERRDVPSLCGVSLPDMVSREEKIERAFMEMHETAPAATGKSCNAISLMILGNGQVKLDITSGELADGEEEIRYREWRKKVEVGKPRPVAQKMSEEQIKEIQEKTSELYRELGTEFYSFLPDEDFKIGYFYAETDGKNVFFFHRLITNDGETVDGDELFDRFSMDKDEAVNNRMAVVKYIMDIRKVFVDSKQNPFTTITLSVTGKGAFQSQLGFGQINPDGEQARLDAWKKEHTGE